MIMALAQCYYYRLPFELRRKYEAFIDDEMKKVKNIVNTVDNYFLQTIDCGQKFYIDDLNIPNGIALNRAFKENIFAMLVGMYYVNMSISR